MTRAMVFACALAALTAVAQRPADADPRNPSEVFERSRVAVEPAGRAFKELSIENPLGDVRVEGYDGNAIVIETHKHAPDDEALDRLRVSLVPNADGTVRITTAVDSTRESRPVARGSVRIDLVIRAPRDARIDAAVTSGKLEVVDMDAGGELDTASGAIIVRNIQGTLLTHSVSGATTLAQVFGSVDAQTMSSDVDLDTINGDKLVASAHHGKIEGRRVRARDVELTTTDGKIRLEGEASLRGHIVVSSLRGDIDVRLRRVGPILVRARGAKVNLGAPAPTKPNGWVEMSTGVAGDHPAMVEMIAPLARIDFAFLQ
jgi:hypothetical protein